jgi:hypothetical protein
LTRLDSNNDLFCFEKNTKRYREQLLNPVKVNHNIIYDRQQVF